MIKECDNISNCHDNVIIGEDSNAMRTYCKICSKQSVIRKDWRGVPENRQYSKVFKRDILQGNDNLLYKYNPQYIQK